MTKKQVVTAIAERTGVSQSATNDVIAAMLEVITEALQRGEDVQFVGFGTFDVRERAAHIVRNPQTKEEIQIPTTRAVHFKAGKDLKEAVAKA